MQSDFSCTPQGTDAHHAPQGQHHNPHWPKGSGQKHHASAIDGKSPKELLGATRGDAVEKRFYLRVIRDHVVCNVKDLFAPRMRQSLLSIKDAT